MANLMDLLVDEDTGDLSIINGDFGITSTSAESLRQRIELRFGTWKGEWAYNTTFGTPYRQKLLIGGVTQAQADAEFIAQINLEEDVTAIRNITSTYNPVTRSYVLSRIEAYVNEELIDISLVSPETTKFSYPEPIPVTDVSFNVCELDQEFVDQANALYELLNFDLPSTGDSTWWNIWGTDTGYAMATYVDVDYFANEYQ